MTTLQDMAIKPSFRDIAAHVELAPDGSIIRVKGQHAGLPVKPARGRSQYVSVGGIEIRYCELKYMLENGKWPPAGYFLTNVGGGNKVRISEDSPYRIVMKKLFNKQYKRMPDPLRNVKEFISKRI